MRFPRNLALAFALGTPAAAAADSAPILTAPPGSFSSSEQCGACHRDIHAAWKLSAHSGSLEDPLFLDALRELADQGGDIGVCLRCHTPTVERTRDKALEKKITWEGITCDYCHSVSAVTPGDLPNLVLDVGATKYGPIRDAASTAHKSAYRDFFTKSEVCAPCHEYVSPAGIAILTTYSEWKASPHAAKGETCQSCHMGEVKANVVDPKVKRATSSTVNLHSMPGGHSIEQLNRAILARPRLERKEGRVDLQVDVVNRGAGHAVPAGSAARQMVLEVRIDTNKGRGESQSRIYERVLTDAAGTPLWRDQDLFSRAAKVGQDTRIQAGETRTERFTFQVDPKALANVKLRLTYRYTPGPGREAAVSQLFFTQSWTLTPE